MLKILDLFCGAGGAAVGYSYFNSEAELEITGIDINPQPNYPFAFIRADALTLPPVHLASYDFIHASPPCQGYSVTRTRHSGRGLMYPRLIPQVHQMLLESGKPFVIENVVGAPLVDPIILCGLMFNLGTFRHRLFETNLPISEPAHPQHPANDGGVGDRDFAWIFGNNFTLSEASKAMDIDWMNKDEIAEAIPPAYTKYLAFQLFPQLVGAPA